jgi:hypothetical protein
VTLRIVGGTSVSLLLVVGRLLAQQPGPLDSGEIRRWREDLAFLRTEMPAQHASLFHAMTRAQFDSGLGSIERRLPTLARHQVIVELMKLDALVGDGHSNVSPWRDTASGFHSLPVAFYWFDDGLYVRAATLTQTGLVGARVVDIGGLPVDSAIARVRPLISRDNEMGVRAWAPILLAMPEVLHAVGLASDLTHVRIGVERAGRRTDATLASAGAFPMLTGETDRTWLAREGWVDARDHAPTPLWLRDPTNTYWFRYLPQGRTLYCQVNAIQQKPDDSVSVFMARAVATADSAGADRFVLDLRLNGGGNGDWNRAILLALIKSRYDTPGGGRLFVLIGRRTWSAAEMLIAEIEKYTNAIFVGEPSASRGNAYGDARRIVLPNSHVTVRVSTLYWQFWDPRDQRPWIAPSVSAPLTMADYQAGRDAALEGAIRYPGGR